MRERVAVTTVWKFQVHRPDGTLRLERTQRNKVPTAGLNKLLEGLVTGLSSPVWYLGLIDESGFSALADADTIGSHAGWTESTDYSESVRQTFTPGAIAAGAVDNSASPAVFTINAVKTIRGCFLVSNSTKGGSTGTLYSEAAGSLGPVPLAIGETLTVTGTLVVTSAT